MIRGLTYIPEFISSSQEKELIDFIDGQPWLNDLKRRTQHYGYKYSYKERKIDQSMYLGPLPAIFAAWASNLINESLFVDWPDQVIVNEYLPGQGISPHVDCRTCFGPVIGSISLLSPCMMEFNKNAELHRQFLKPRGLLILKEDARYRYAHSISARKDDVMDDESVITRTRRVSVTFRNIIKE